MEKQKMNSYRRTSVQVERIRKIYNQIGQPLPADIIIDLHLHLGQALNAVDTPAPDRRHKKKHDA